MAKIGYEIIRRWLRGQEPSLYHHQERHYYWHQLSKHARWDKDAGEWVPRETAGEQQAG